MAISRRTFLAAAAATLAMPVSAARPTRQHAKALVVSLSYYTSPGNLLPNTIADGNLIADAFRGLHFDAVTVIRDEPAPAILAHIADFLGSLERGDLAVAYFAGHGLQIADENFLVLSGGETFLSLRSLIDSLRARTDTVILFLDACRNNPFEEVPETAHVSRAITPSGAAPNFVTLDVAQLAERDAAARTPSALRPFSLQGSGVKIVFSTDPNNVALDGATPASRNSPFAQSLAQRVRERRSLDDVISMATGDVISATEGSQSPWSQGSIDRPIFLAGPPLQRNPARPPFQVPG